MLLIVSHCPALVVRVVIQCIPNLLGFEIYNCTIAEWSKEATLSAVAHPRMTYATLTLANMTELSNGLLEPLRKLLFDIEISVTNLTTLPDDLHVRWHSLSVFYMEHGQLTAFPETLLKLDVYDLSLIGNRIETLSDLSGSPLCTAGAIQEDQQ